MRIPLFFFLYFMGAVAFPSKMSKLIHCKQLFGEWQIRYSDDPRFPEKSASIGMIPETGMDRVRISVHPRGKFYVSYRFYRGLLLSEIHQKGEYIVSERSREHLKMNVNFNHSQEKMISFCGIAIDDVHPLLRMDEYEQTYSIEAEIWDKDMFLVATSDEEKNPFYYHMIRSESLNQPTVQVPISNLIFSNIISMIFTYLIHIIFRHPSTGI